MVFNDFRFRVIFRVLLLALTLAGIVYFVMVQRNYISVALSIIILIIQLWELFRFISQTNKKLTRFLESIKYSDFVSGFSSDNKLGKSFKELNVAFNEVMNAFRKERSEKEEHLQYLNTVVQHVSTGLLAYNSEGEVELINETAKQLIGAPQIHNIEELIENKSRLYKAIFDLPPGKSALFTNDSNVQLSISATTFVLKNQSIKLIALHNIQPELQKKELEAWQNLTKVLRHEIMNSITPIASLTSTLKQILDEDLKALKEEYVVQNETVEDLREGLSTIKNRSTGLINFINAYRDYTNIPRPQFKAINLPQLIINVENLLKIELQKHNINFKHNHGDDAYELEGDHELLEMVLINLVKNAIEATLNNPSPTIIVNLYRSNNGQINIKVIDNGQGIIPEAIEKIFIPFYTTKSTGSGIGLSLSRQIMQLHHGTLNVTSTPEEGTTFTMSF